MVYFFKNVRIHRVPVRVRLQVPLERHTRVGKPENPKWHTPVAKKFEETEFQVAFPVVESEGQLANCVIILYFVTRNRWSQGGYSTYVNMSC